MRFFVQRAGQLNMVSFQVQADTGRGIWGKRGAIVTPAGVRQRIEQGANNTLDWNSIAIGHPRCHRYAPTMIIGNRAHSLITDPQFYARWLEDFADITVDRRSPVGEQLRAYLKALKDKPSWAIRAPAYVTQWLWRARRDLWKNQER